MTILATVTKNGNSAGVNLPTSLRKQVGIRIGDQIEINVRPDRIIELRRVGAASDKAEKAKELVDFIESYDVGPWVRSDSKEADRELIGERYAE